VTVALILNRRSVAVTNANKHEYVARLVQPVLVERASEQLFALCIGFNQVMPHDLLLISLLYELACMVCSLNEIDVDEWEREAEYDQYLFDCPAKKFSL
jgi:hypothetical protein